MHVGIGCPIPPFLGKGSLQEHTLYKIKRPVLLHRPFYKVVATACGVIGRRGLFYYLLV